MVKVVLFDTFMRTAAPAILDSEGISCHQSPRAAGTQQFHINNDSIIDQSGRITKNKSRRQKYKERLTPVLKFNVCMPIERARSYDMPATHRSTRSSQRRKMVLPVTVVRNNGEKQLAHTLDLTEVSARLGGLCTQLEPGEVIEIHRGAVKAKFQVFWMGAPGSAMEGQAGVRTLEAGKIIWGINLPEDERDLVPQGAGHRQEMPPVRTNVPSPGEKRWHTRFECSGGASVRAANTTFPVHAQVKDISQGGVYVETTAPMPVNTEVNIKMNVEGVAIETAGVVRTSYPMVGMGVSFLRISPANQEKVNGIILALRGKASPAKAVDAQMEQADASALAGQLTRPDAATPRLASYSAHVLAAALREFTAGMDEWKSKCAAGEADEVRQAIQELQTRMMVPQVEMVDYFAPQSPRGLA
jgi:hypothetical protein